MEDFSKELKQLIEEYIEENSLDLNIKCYKNSDVYQIDVYDNYQNFIENKSIPKKIVNDYFINKNQKAKDAILSFIEKDGPQVKK